MQPRGYDSIPVCEDYPVSLDDLEYPTPDIGYCKATEVKDIDSEVVKFCNFEKYERIFHWSGVTEKYGFTEESAMETWGLFQTYFTDFQLGYIKVSDVFEAMRRAICPGVLYPPCNAACDPQYYCLGSFHKYLMDLPDTKLLEGINEKLYQEFSDGNCENIGKAERVGIRHPGYADSTPR